MEKALEELLDSIEAYVAEVEFPLTDSAAAEFVRMIDAYTTVRAMLANEEESE